MPKSVPNIYGIIMAGGVGTRLWPYSRNKLPKQFLDLMDEQCSLLQMNYAHMSRHVDPRRIFVVTHEAYVSLVLKHLPDLPPSQVLAEPLRRNTAPCIAYASFRIASQNKEAVSIVMSADHVIKNDAHFDKAIGESLHALKGNSKSLVMLGIHPQRPETGYGYIQYVKDGKNPIKQVKTFTEKPALAFAKKFIESGDFLWNAGIYVWRVETILEALRRHSSVLYEVFQEKKEVYGTSEEKAFIGKVYSMIPTISIDYAVLEKEQEVYVVPCSFLWADVGSWKSLYDLKSNAKKDNVALNQAQVMAHDSKKNIIYTWKKNKLVVLGDLEDYLVGDFEDILIVCSKANEASFRTYVKDVREQKGERYV